MLSLSLDFYGNIAFPYYLSQFLFLLLEAEAFWLEEVTKFASWGPINFLNCTLMMFCIVLNLCWMNHFMCSVVTNADLVILSQELLTIFHDFLLLPLPASSLAALLISHSIILQLFGYASLSLISSFVHALSTDSDNFLDDLFPQTFPPLNLDLGIISPGKPSLLWPFLYFSSMLVFPYQSTFHCIWKWPIISSGLWILWGQETSVYSFVPRA